MERVFIIPEQIKLLETPYIAYVGKGVLKFDKHVLKPLCATYLIGDIKG